MSVFCVKERFYSLQGEGLRAGQAAVFCRFSGCNLHCDFCDTDHTGTDGSGGGSFADAASLASAIMQTFPPEALQRLRAGSIRPYVIFTGGEPGLQLTDELIDVLHQQGCELAVESNGTVPLPKQLDWVCISPKTAKLAVTSGHELKLVWPQQGLTPEQFEDLDFANFVLQPKFEQGSNYTELCVRWCLDHPRWRLGLQQHRLLGIM